MAWKFKNVNCHEDEAITVNGLRQLLKTMRYCDLVEFATGLESFRRGATEGKSARRLTAEFIQDWLDNP